MKRILLIINNLLFLSSVLAQHFNYLNGVWFELAESIGPQYANIRAKLSPDTTQINGRVYHELLRSEDQSGDNFLGTGDFIRYKMDSIFHVRRSSFKESLLYHFNLNLGDTITSDQFFMDLIVKSVDTITLLDGSKRTAFELNELNGESYTTWISGIGSLRGFLDPLNMFYGSDNTAILCYYENDVHLYENPNFNECWIVSTISELDQNKDDKPIYFDSQNRQLVIRNESGLLQSKPLLSVYTLDGKLLQELRMDQGRIDLPIAQTGIYIYTLSQNGQVLGSGKVILKQ